VEVYVIVPRVCPSSTSQSEKGSPLRVFPCSVRIAFLQGSHARSPVQCVIRERTNRHVRKYYYARERKQKDSIRIPKDSIRVPLRFYSASKRFYSAWKVEVAGRPPKSVFFESREPSVIKTAFVPVFGSYTFADTEFEVFSPEST